ncbi:hypothetical protein [Paenibacillus hamazuiensis]|uniref:hypothetical protein n=1 Tax=Paenibacillus hamazuiensis TaxID=2936508 RepID=UPI00200C80B1|nr:hypothetical protein [Paenibacillus hamazuiensis]
MKTALFFVGITAYLASAFYPADALHWMVSAVSLLIVAAVFGFVKPFVRALGTIFVTIGIVLLAAHGAPWRSFISGFGNMMNILSLFALIPLIALPIELGNYGARIQAIIQKTVKHSGLLYLVTSALSYILSSFMNLATLPMVYHTIRSSLELYPIEQKERFMSRAITHGYSMPIVWTPVAPIVGIVVEMTGVKWSSILPVAIPFSVLGLVLDGMMGRWIAGRRLKRLGSEAAAQIFAARENAVRPKAGQNVREKAGHPGQIIAAIVLFNILISALEKYTHAGFLLLVSASVVPFAFVWSLLLGKGKLFLTKSRTMLPAHLMKMKEQFFVFLCAGFMISAIQSTGAGHVIGEWIIAAKDVVGPGVFLLLIPFIPFLLAFAGLHPAVGLALAAESLNPQALGISAWLVALAMLIGAATAFLMGPYNATAGMMAGLSGQSAFRVSNWNAPFTAAYLGLGIILLLMLEKVG